VADTKHTITERSFRPYMTPTGNETLPNSLYYGGTGFVRGKILHNATSAEVYFYVCRCFTHKCMVTAVVASVASM